MLCRVRNEMERSCQSTHVTRALWLSHLFPQCTNFLTPKERLLLCDYCWTDNGHVGEHLGDLRGGVLGYLIIKDPLALAMTPSSFVRVSCVWDHFLFSGVPFESLIKGWKHCTNTFRIVFYNHLHFFTFEDFFCVCQDW